MRFKTARLAAVLFSLGVASSASAAVKARPAAIAPLPSWTGFYVGINGGGAGTENQSMTYADLAINAYFPATVNASTTSGLAGFHAGYNYQFAPTGCSVSKETGTGLI
jgi:outer membrane immunogenic protein